MKIVQFGLHYSPNTGDGIIAECLGHAVRQSAPEAQYETVDFSGRDGFGAVTVRNRQAALAILGLLPRGLRGRLVEYRLTRMLDRAEPAWEAALQGADLAILGGGQIFSDADLNFCTKIARVARLTARAGVPMVIHAAGVSQNWSRRGTELFSAVFDTQLQQVGLRDPGSISAWQAQSAGQGPEPVLTRDPGLLAAACYGPNPAADAAVGLCVTDPAILRYHSDSGVAGAGQDGIGFFVALTEALVQQGHQVRLFCNGAAEDRQALAQVASDARIAPLLASGQVGTAAPPETPTELAAVVSSCRAIIAHRMHACIVAYGYRIPTVGLGWDRKLESFFASVGEDTSFVGGAAATVPQVVACLAAALDRGIPAERHAAVLAETRDAVTAVLAKV